MYQLAELHRLRGEIPEAEAAYRQANEFGQYPHPGLARLRLAQGRLDVAAAAIRGAAEEVTDRLARAGILAAFVDIMVTTREVVAARAASDELVAIAMDAGAPLLKARAAHARGAVLLAEGDARGALTALGEARGGWSELRAPYDDARTRVLVGLARGELGDLETAQLELDAARSIFVELGARPDVELMDRLARSTPPDHGAGGLSPRELEVLRLVATGKTNHAIAAELVLSEKTVARHVSNIFAKLDVPSRSAATAYAYEHHLT